MSDYDFDTEIALEVMGWTRIPRPDHVPPPSNDPYYLNWAPPGLDPSTPWQPLPNYRGDWVAAFAVRDEIMRRTCVEQMLFAENVKTIIESRLGYEIKYKYVVSYVTPEIICQAALAAVRGKTL